MMPMEMENGIQVNHLRNNGNVALGQEYLDINQNNAYDPGRTMVFRNRPSRFLFQWHSVAIFLDLHR